MSLSPLPDVAEADFVRSLLGPHAQQDVINAIAAGAEGNPLFLEERLLSMLETGALVKQNGAGGSNMVLRAGRLRFWNAWYGPGWTVWALALVMP